MTGRKRIYPPRGKKSGYSRGDIKRYLDDSWYFRKKKVDGHWYISRRKGRNERSLGRYNAELWTIIEEESGKSSEKVEEEKISQKIDINDEKNGSQIKLTYDIFDSLREKISQDRGLRMTHDCLHIWDRYCTRWTWNKKPGFFKYVDALFGANNDAYKLIDTVDNGKIVKRWAIRVFCDFCKDCPAYKNLRDVTFDEAYKIAQFEKSRGGLLSS